MTALFKKPQRGSSPEPEPEPTPEASGQALTEREEAVRLAAQMVGAAQGLAMASRSSMVFHLLAIQQVKEQKAYREMGHNWETFCAGILGRHRASVDEDLRNLATFGQEFMETAERISLGRDALRSLRRLPDGTRPRVLPTGELEVGDTRVPLDASHAEQIEDLLEQLVEGQQRLEDRIQKGEAQLAQRDEQLAARRQAIEELEAKVEQLQSRGGPSELVSEWARAMMTVHLAVMRALRLIEEEQPDKQLLHRFYVMTTRQWDQVLKYTTGYDTEAAAAGVRQYEEEHGLTEEDIREMGL